MASYQARQRDPLLDSRTQALLEQRGKEMLGFALIILSIVLGLILWSYSPDDPSWISATDGPVHNLFGRFGATIAWPLMLVVGLASWSLSLLMLVLGIRLMAHLGEERALRRAIFIPMAVVMASVYASTLVPGANWQHSFGLGGMFGDTVLGAVIGVLPLDAGTALKLLSLALFAAMLALLAFVGGTSRGEMRLFGRFLLYGIIMLYSALMRLLGLSASGTFHGLRGIARHAAEKRARRRAARQERRAARRREPELAGGGKIHETRRRAEPGLSGGMRVRLGAAPEKAPFDGGEENFRRQERARGNLLRRLLGRSPAAEPAADDDLPLADPDDLRPELFSDDEFVNPELRRKIARLARERMEAEQRRQFEEAAKGDPATAAAAGPATAQAPLDPGPALGAVPPARPRPDEAPAQPVVRHPAKKRLRKSSRAKAEEQPSLPFADSAAEYEHPPLSLLESPSEANRLQLSDEALEQNARMLATVLDDYGVKGEIVSVRPGPVVTMYELEPAPGLKASRVIGLADDIARSMSALSARVSTVPGRSVIGIELPNEQREMVMLREILSSREFGDSHMKLPLALGKDISGGPTVADLAKMPHLLIAGTTGSGKSVAINTMILSLLYTLSPEECRLIMIDPKMLELSVYDGIPHLLSPVVTDPKKAVVALKWVVAEMEERYRKMSKMGVRNIEGYNSRVQAALDRNEMFSRTVQTGFDDETGEPIFETEEFAPEKLPYIVVIVDEMADLMMVAGKEIEACIQRLAQMARASGIHLIMATQRPSVDVITGTIKANFPTRISFQVTSKVDSRTILGEQGAEQLLGMGDMLYMAGGARITRVHGPFVSDEEVEEVVNHLKAFGPPEYVSGVVEGPDAEKESELDQVLGLGGNTGAEDALYDQAVAIVARDRKCSTSYIQRKLAIGYNKAARLVEQMEEQGIVSPANHVGKREILIPEQP